MTRELRDFAESLLRIDSEREMWWERSQELAKESRLLAAANHSLLADVATLTTERDALAARVAELEAKLEPAAPVEEVDGFRVGDLVSAHGCAPEPIARIVLGYVHLDGAGFSTHSRGLTRKPVAIGDTVRCVSGPFAGRTGRVEHDYVASMSVCTGPGEGSFWTTPTKLVAVAP